jgi:hypothetical protein
LAILGGGCHLWLHVKEERPDSSAVDDDHLFLLFGRRHSGIAVALVIGPLIFESFGKEEGISELPREEQQQQLHIVN